MRLRRQQARRMREVQRFDALRTADGETGRLLRPVGGRREIVTDEGCGAFPELLAASVPDTTVRAGSTVSILAARGGKKKLVIERAPVGGGPASESEAGTSTLAPAPAGGDAIYLAVFQGSFSAVLYDATGQPAGDFGSEVATAEIPWAPDPHPTLVTGVDGPRLGWIPAGGLIYVTEIGAGPTARTGLRVADLAAGELRTYDPPEEWHVIGGAWMPAASEVWWMEMRFLEFFPAPQPDEAQYRLVKAPADLSSPTVAWTRTGYGASQATKFPAVFRGEGGVLLWPLDARRSFKLGFTASSVVVDTFHADTAIYYLERIRFDAATGESNENPQFEQADASQNAYQEAGAIGQCGAPSPTAGQTVGGNREFTDLDADPPPTTGWLEWKNGWVANARLSSIGGDGTRLVVSNGAEAAEGAAADADPTNAAVTLADHPTKGTPDYVFPAPPA